jgi:hypothetical protein
MVAIVLDRPAYLNGGDVPPSEPAPETNPDEVQVTHEMQGGIEQVIVQVPVQDAGKPARHMYDSQIRISQSAETVSVNVDGKIYRFSGADAQHLNIRGSGKQETITIDCSVKVNLMVDSGDGNDIITNHGRGNNTLNGGSGNDKIFDDGAGSDALNGSDGDDTIRGRGKGSYTINGDAGNDALFGGSGENKIVDTSGINYLSDGKGGHTNIVDSGEHDIIVALQPDTSVLSMSSTAAIYTGAGDPVISNFGGLATIYTQNKNPTRLFSLLGLNRVVNVDAEGQPGSSLRIKGSAQFKAKVEADMEVLRASPDGRNMLRTLDAQYAQNGKRVTIKELDEPIAMEHMSSTENALTEPEDFDDAVLRKNGTPGAGTNATVYYNPDISPGVAKGLMTPPVVELFHEMGHVYNMVTGTMQDGQNRATAFDKGVGNWERQVLGLEGEGVPYDFDHDPTTPPTTYNPLEFTENGERIEMGLSRRWVYDPRTVNAQTLKEFFKDLFGTR